MATRLLKNPTKVLTDCDNIDNIDGQRMATVLGKHIAGYDKRPDNTRVDRVLGVDSQGDIRWSKNIPGGGGGEDYTAGDGIDISAAEVISAKVGAGLMIADYSQSSHVSETVTVAGRNTVFQIYNFEYLAPCTADIINAINTSGVSFTTANNFSYGPAGVNANITGCYAAILSKTENYAPSVANRLVLGSVAYVDTTEDPDASITQSVKVTSGTVATFSMSDYDSAASTITLADVQADPAGYVLALVAYDAGYTSWGICNFGLIGTATATTGSIAYDSGYSVEDAINVTNPLPASAVGDAGKVLTVDSSGSPAWEPSQGGGGESYTAGSGINISSENVISADTSVVQPKLTAGTNVSISNQNVISATDTTYGVFNTTTDGLVPKASGTGDTGKFLKGDGTWDSPLTAASTTAPIYGDGTSTSPIRLLVSHGLSLVQPSGGDTALQVTHPVPAPGSTSTNKVLTCTDALENLAWRDVPTGASIKKKDYGDTDPSNVSTLLIDADDPEGYSLLKADNSIKGYLVQGPYKTLLDSGVNGVGDSSTPVYIDGNGQFSTCSITPGGAKRSNTAELYFHHSQDGDHYNVRNVKNYCINHVAVTGHFGDICYVEIEAPTLDGNGEEYDYVVVFDCVNSSGSTKHVVVQNADPEIFTYPLDSASNVVQITQTLVYFDGSIRSQIEVLGGRFTVHSY